MKQRLLDLLTFGVSLVWAIIVLPRMFTGAWSPLAEQLIAHAGGMIRLAFLVVAAVASSKALTALNADNPARSSQGFLAAGFCAYLAAQLSLFVLQLFSGGETPYPSIADAGFTLALVLLIFGVALAIRSWLELGLFPDGGRKALIAAMVVAVPLAVGVTITLVTLSSASTSIWQKAVDTAYPVLDSVLLVLTAAMLRLTALLGRGSVGAVWRSLLFGFLAMAVADVVYSFFAGFNLTRLDPLLDLLYTLAYALFARGAVLQLRLLRADR